MLLERLKEFSYIILHSSLLFRKTNFKIRNQRDKEYNVYNFFVLFVIIG